MEDFLGRVRSPAKGVCSPVSLTPAHCSVDLCVKIARRVLGIVRHVLSGKQNKLKKLHFPAPTVTLHSHVQEDRVSTIGIFLLKVSKLSLEPRTLSFASSFWLNILTVMQSVCNWDFCNISCLSCVVEIIGNHDTVISLLFLVGLNGNYFYLSTPFCH